MRRIIVDYAKLTNDILSLLVEKFPDGYEDSDIIRFRNLQNELVEAVEVRTEDTIYLVKVSKKLATRIENFEEEEDDIDLEVEAIAPVKGIDLDDEEEDEEDEEETALDEDDEEEDGSPKKRKRKIEEDEEEDEDY